ncbi:MAG: T9SS type A sorting domain-containing protein [bacterium]
MKKYLIALVLIGVVSLPLHAQTLSWSQIQGPYAVSVNSFATAGAALYAGTSDGLFVSSNGGDTWALKQAAAANDILVVDATIFIGGYSGVVVSEDNGTTWAVRDTGLPILPLVYAVRKSGTSLFACLANEGLYRSKDNSKSWTSVGGEVSGKSITAMIVGNSALVVAPGLGVLRSTNNGDSWSDPGGDISNQSVHSFTKLGTILYAGTDAGVFMSDDDGANWMKMSKGMSADENVTALHVAGNIVYAGTTNPDPNTGGVYRSVDSGATWEIISNGLINHMITSIYSTNTRIFAGSSLAISMMEKGSNLWQTMSNGLPKEVVTSFAGIWNTGFAGTSGSYVFSTDDRGVHWDIRKDGISRANVTSMFAKGSVLLAGTDGRPKNGLGGIHRSTDNGLTWGQANSGMPIMSITSIVSDGTKIYAGGDSGVFSSVDDGKSWSRYTTEVPMVLLSTPTAFFEVQKSAIYKFVPGSGWSIISSETIGNTIRSATANGSYIFVGTDSGVLRSSNGGTQWSTVGSDTLHVQALWSNDLLVAAGTTHGLYVSSDHGTTWKYQSLIGDVSVTTIGVGHRDIYVASTTGTFSAPLEQYSVQSSATKSNLHLTLTNPANTSLDISFDTPRHEFGKVGIYDILGTLKLGSASQSFNEGENHLHFDTSHLLTGTYVVRLDLGEKNTSALMQIIH